MSTSTAIPARESSSLRAWMAWRRYLMTVRAADPEWYTLVEESAWERLRDELAAAGRPLGGDAPARILG